MEFASYYHISSRTVFCGGRRAVGADEIWANHEVTLLSCLSPLYGLARRGSEIFQSIVNALAASVKARF
jgi:hypothetical protein